MEKYNNWNLKFYTIWAGQAVSLITSDILQMAIIFSLQKNKICDGLVYGFTSRFFYPMRSLDLPSMYWVLVDRHDRKKRIQIRDRNPARRIISNTTKPATLVPKLQVLDIFIC
mgnify:CR=1 FL=1|jgi:DHA3 family macrolide efflux protein-like MFS transporter